MRDRSVLVLLLASLLVPPVGARGGPQDPGPATDPGAGALPRTAQVGPADAADGPGADATEDGIEDAREDGAPARATGAALERLRARFEAGPAAWVPGDPGRFVEHADALGVERVRAALGAASAGRDDLADACLLAGSELDVDLDAPDGPRARATRARWAEQLEERARERASRARTRAPSSPDPAGSSPAGSEPAGSDPAEPGAAPAEATAASEAPGGPPAVDAADGLDPLARALLDRAYALRHLARGCRPPGFRTADALGNELRLADLRGQLVVLRFWAPGERVPQRRLRRRVDEVRRVWDLPVTWVEVAHTPERARLLEGLERAGVHWTVAWEPDGHAGAAEAWRVRGARTFLLDREGRVLGVDLAGEALLARMREALEATADGPEAARAPDRTPEATPERRAPAARGRPGEGAGGDR